MKKITIILAAAVLALVSLRSCNVEPQPFDLQPAYKYTDAYYEALRAYKQSDHAIAYIFFGDYGTPYSPAFRFMGIPDSVDVVNLWGGFPKPGTLDYEEMHQMRRLKGTKVVGCKIIRLAPNNTNYYSQSWAKEAEIPSFMAAYNATYGGQYKTNYETIYETTYERLVAEGKSPEEAAAAADETAKDGAAAAAETSAMAAGIGALRSDMSANPARTLISGSEDEGNAVYEYPEWCVFAADWILMQVWENDLDGYDLDWEPEGDALDGTAFLTFLQYLAQYIGPLSEDPSKLLIIDRNTRFMNGPQYAKYCNYWIHQKYGGTGGASRTTDSDYPLTDDPSTGWVNSQIIVCENVGDTWTTGGRVEEFAAFNPSAGGRKGGFAAFHGQRDYNTTESGADKDMPYGHIRRAIQIQNPAVTE